MEPYLPIILVCACASRLVMSVTDPCKDSKELPQMNIRYKAYKVDPDGHDFLEDFYLTEGWYNVGKKHMIKFYPGANRCGTIYPIYLKGDTDIGDGVEVTREICAYDFFTDGCRGDTKNIKIKNCTDYSAYYLNPTEEYEAYCFEDDDEPPTDDKEVAPTEQVKQEPVVSCAMQFKVIRNKRLPMYSCSCSFTALNDDSLLYQIIWYKNGYRAHVSEQVSYKDIAETNFSEDRFGGLGLTVSCIVKISKRKFGLTGPPSKPSVGEFIGIKVERNKYVVKSGEVVKVNIKITMPVQCILPLRKCHIKLGLLVQDQIGQCNSKLATLRQCTLQIDSDKWNQNHVFEISTKSTMDYEVKGDKVKRFLVTLQAIKNNRVHQLWDKYTLPPLPIELHDDTGGDKWKGKSCFAHSDPHMKTFDGFYYENQHPGTFLMYRNTKTIFGVLEVQVKMGSCAGFPPVIYCVCGLAVRAGQDVYKIDRCNLNKMAVMKHLTCGSNYLDVRKVTDWNYRIYLPTGTYITSVQGYRFLEVDIFPYKDDVDNTQGLCGKLNDKQEDDLRHRGSDKPESIDGYLRSYKYDRNPAAFSRSWTVTDEDNLLTKYSQNDIKKCIEKDAQIKTMSLCECHEKKVVCKGSKITENCKNNWTKKPVNCNVQTSNVRKRRFAHQPDNVIPNYRLERHHKRIKREASTLKQVNMTMKQARLHCERNLKKSPSFRACEKVPHINTTVSVEHCIADIMLSQTLMWESVAREGLKGSCIKELQQNGTLREEPADGSPSIAEKIFEVACPNECSGNGICKNGTCQCTGTYGAADCSLDLTDPPIVNGINIDEGGLCDINECSVAFVFGDNFLDTQNLTCMRTHFEIDINNTINSVGQDTLFGDHQTITEIHCSLARLTSKQDVAIITRGNPFVRKMMIAISNDGNRFGDNHTLFILDSKCQDTSDQNGTLIFALKGGWCFIEGQCVINGGININDSSKMCDVLKDRFSWTDVPTTEALTTLEATSDSSTVHVTTIPVTGFDFTTSSELLTTTEEKQRMDTTTAVSMSTTGESVELSTLSEPTASTAKAKTTPSPPRPSPSSSSKTPTTTAKTIRKIVTTDSVSLTTTEMKLNKEINDEKEIEDDKMLLGAIIAIAIFIIAVAALITMVVILKQRKRREYSVAVGEPLLMDLYKKDENESANRGQEVLENEGNKENKCSSDENNDKEIRGEKRLESERDSENEPFINDQGVETCTVDDSTKHFENVPGDSTCMEEDAKAARENETEKEDKEGSDTVDSNVVSNISHENC